MLPGLYLLMDEGIWGVPRLHRDTTAESASSFEVGLDLPRKRCRRLDIYC